MDASTNERLAAEAIRLFRRYSVEIVEELGLCPWARGARRDGRVREHVVLSPALDVDEVLAAVDRLAADDAVEIGIILFPRVDVDRATFEQFVAGVRAENEARCRPHAVPFAMAEFHPRAAAVLAPDGAFTSFVRRTPDPTIQLVRQSALAHVRRGEKSHGSGFFDVRTLDYDALLNAPLTTTEAPLHERVLAANRGTIEALGVEAVVARLEDIERDRATSYARILSDGAHAPP